MAEGVRPAESDSGNSLTGHRIGRFVVETRLGEGGMGEVYRAEDTLLRRTVALKRLSPSLHTGESYKRLVSEAERASRIIDPNVAAIHDLIEHEGNAFIVMEYVHGETLRERLKRSISPEEAVEIAAGAASALCAAHEQGVLHCDIKPENIMLAAAGGVKVLDFGIARRCPTPDHTTITLTGTTERFSGTPAYMSPEVIEEGAPAAVSDIFSLGVVLYESLTGVNPFRAATLIATGNRIVHHDPEPPSRVNPRVEERFDAVVMRMLAKNPAERQASAREVLEQLRALQGGAAPLPVPRAAKPRWRAWHAIAAAAGVLAIVLLVAPLVWRRSTRVEAKVRDVAVLPFAATGESDATRAFSDGLAETLSAKLSQLSGRYPIQIVPASEVRDQHVTSAEQAAQWLSAELVLQGTLRQSGDQVRITYALIDTRSKRQVSADLITASMRDPFVVEDRVVDSVLNALDIALRPTERAALASGRPAQPTAYDFYLQGRGFLQDFHKPENLDAALRAFDAALQHDPKYAPAYAGVGATYWYKYELSKDPVSISKVADACNQAVSLDPAYAGAHVCLGTMYNGTGKYEKAVEEFTRALRNDPASDEALAGLGASYEALHKLGEAEATMKRALQIRPNYWGGYHRLGVFYFRNSRYPEAAQAFTKVTELAPDSFRAYSNLGGVYLATGEYEKAITALRRSAEIRPTGPALANMAAAQFYLRRYGDSASSNEQSLEADDTDYVVWGNLGESYYWAGRRDDADRALRRALQIAEGNSAVNPRDAAILADRAWFSAMLADAASADKHLASALRLAPADVEVLFKAALVHKYLGRDTESRRWLEKALHAGLGPRRVRDNPVFDSLRADSKFNKLMQQ